MFDFFNPQDESQGYSPVIPVPTQRAIQNYSAQNNNQLQDTNPIGSSFLRNENGSFNTGNIKLGLGAFQTLGSLWMASKQNKLAKKSLKLQERAFETNLGNQTKSYNTALEDRIRTRYNTEGRSSEQADSYIEKNRL